MSIKTIKKSISAAAFGSTMIATRVFAQTNEISNAVDKVKPADVQNTSLESYIQTIINVLLGLIGVVAVIMLIYGGFRYVLSAGNEKATSAAKDTILFAIIGIVVAVLAFAIVNFVIGKKWYSE
jgi:type IV secretory pathway VirB2 component (pilin)